jgi:hypothetical protein
MFESSVITSPFRAGGCAGLASDRQSRNYHCAPIAIGSRQIPHTVGDSSPLAANPRACSLGRAALPSAAVLARAGGLFPIWHNARSPLSGATVRNAGVFDGLPQTAPGVRALHEQTGGRIA